MSVSSSNPPAPGPRSSSSSSEAAWSPNGLARLFLSRLLVLVTAALLTSSYDPVSIRLYCNNNNNNKVVHRSNRNPPRYVPRAADPRSRHHLAPRRDAAPHHPHHWRFLVPSCFLAVGLTMVKVKMKLFKSLITRGAQGAAEGNTSNIDTVYLSKAS